MNTYPMSAEAAELARDQFTGPDPDRLYQPALNSLQDKAESDPLRCLMPYLENDVWDLAQDAVLMANSGNYSESFCAAKDRITDRMALALRQYQDANVEAEIERLAELEREEQEAA